ncbi:relaxase/mobilization nuclease domain-containing protein [Cupriavidus pauculus]|uniref:relaxase/mobilization nuclease domain-containing protein n=1 Tax=Cupriavidus pauculus TaxID=82633 RepID=UPI003857ADEE
MSQRDDDDDIRLTLKLPKRGALKQREVARAAQDLRRLLGRTGRRGGGGKSGGGRMGLRGAAARSNQVRPAAVKGGAGSMQRVAVRMTYAKNKGNRQWEAHGKYLERESGQREGERGQGYGSAGDPVDVPGTLARWQEAGDEHVFKMIVSPEFGDKVDLKAHAAALVAAMEKDLGTKLEWVGIDHHNTDNPHLHIAVRGVDAQGNKLEMAPDYIKRGLRERAQELVTRELGYRTERDIAEAQQRQVSQERFTDLDRALQRRAVGQVVSFSGPPPANAAARETRLNLIRRLSQLTQMGLAEKQADHLGWRLLPELESALRARQIAGDRLKTRALHRAMISDPNAQMVTTELKQVGQRLAGRLIGTGMHEAVDRPYMLVEGVDGKLHFLLQPNKVEQLRGGGKLRAGDYVELTVASLRGPSAKAGAVYLQVEAFGKDLPQALVDRAVQSASERLQPGVATSTVAGAFRRAVATRQADMLRSGALMEAGGKLVVTSPYALDRMRFADAGLQGTPFQTGAPTLGKVLAKGQASVMVQLHDGQLHVVQQGQLMDRGLDLKYVTPGASLFFGEDAKAKPMAMIVKAEDLSALVSEEKTNRLDVLARQLSGLPAGSEVGEAIRQRLDVWRERGLRPESPDFLKDAATWRKNAELAASTQLPELVASPRLNRLDWLMQQPYVPANAPLAEAIEARASTWLQRGVDPKSGDFSIKAGVWRKGFELQQAVAQKGVEKVLEELSINRGKPVRELDCEAGRQVTGSVVLTFKDKDGRTGVVVDTGREVTVIRQPTAEDVPLRVGARVRATVQQGQHIVAGNQRRQQNVWRFADLERSAAMSKDKAKGRDMF